MLASPGSKRRRGARAIAWRSIHVARGLAGFRRHGGEMMLWWIIGAALFVVAALSVWTAFHSPAFVAGLSALAAAAAAKAIVTKAKAPLSEADTKAKNAAERAGRGDEWIRKRLGSLREDR